MAENLESKTCQQCGVVFGPSVELKKRPGRWAHTKFCSTLCANRARAAGQRSQTLNLTCATCSTEFETKRAYRRFCSRTCAAVYARTQAQNERGLAVVKSCEGCGEGYERREKEKAADFKKRRFCSKRCSTKYANSCRDYGMGKKPIPKKTIAPIPPPPPPTEVIIWRPEAWGGPYKLAQST